MPGAVAVSTEVDLDIRFAALDALLADHIGLWQPQPFHVPRPAWCERLPALCTRLLDLGDAELGAYANDSHALIELVAAAVPALHQLHALIDLPRTAVVATPVPAYLATHIPGRKLTQIQAFAVAVGALPHPLLEWCAGKGHLGRLLAWRQAQAVVSLERAPDLIAQGTELARRSGSAQRFVQADALVPSGQAWVRGRHAVALHACGDLHLALLAAVVDTAAPALDLAPCCYHLTRADRYRALSTGARLELRRDDLHLAVSQTITAGAHDRRRTARSQAWKLAFLTLRTAAGGPTGQPFRPLPGAWGGLDFPAWMRLLCEREGVDLAPVTDWQALERRGWERHAEVQRLELVRQAFRRPLEIWLALDRARYLAANGYAVSLQEFCAPEITPRNLLISARRLACP